MKTLLNIKLHLSKKNIFTILVFILVLGGTTGCIQHKSDQKRLPALSFTVNGESFEMIPVEGGTFIMEAQVSKVMIAKTMKNQRMRKLYRSFISESMKLPRNCGKQLWGLISINHTIQDVKIVRQSISVGMTRKSL